HTTGTLLETGFLSKLRRQILDIHADLVQPGGLAVIASACTLTARVGRQTIIGRLLKNRDVLIHLLAVAKEPKWLPLIERQTDDSALKVFAIVHGFAAD